jgi:lysophospholipase L1-like esterase
VRISRAIYSAAIVISSAGLILAASPAGAASAVQYVALGDSYSSGLGAGSYISSSGSCDRSTRAYPEQWAGVNAPGSFVSVACAGATTADVTGSQVSALRPGTTLVSLTIGGNDAGFSGVMETCVLGSTSSCLNAVSKAEATINGPLLGLLVNTLQTIRSRAPAAKIVLLGYPELYDLSRSSTCIGLSTRDRTALNGGADELDGVLSTAAGRVGGVTFADVRHQFATHEICDSGSWLNSVDIFALSSSYHPNANGQILGYLPVFTAAAG